MIEKMIVEEAHGRDERTAEAVLRRAMRAEGLSEVEVERRLAERGLAGGT